MTTIALFPKEVLLQISPSRPQETPYTPQNVDKLPERLQNLAKGDYFLYQPGIAAMSLAADRYQTLALEFNPTLARVCRRFRQVFSLKSDAALTTQIELLISTLLEDRKDGWYFILNCIKCGFYLETLRYYFSLHPEQLKILFPEIAVRVLYGCTPLKFISDLLKLNDIHNLGLLDRTVEGITEVIDRLFQFNIFECLIERRQALIELFNDKFSQQLAQKQRSRCITQEPAKEHLASLPSEIWIIITSHYPALIENRPHDYHIIEARELETASLLFETLHYHPTLMRVCKRFRTIFFSQMQQTIKQIEKIIGILLRRANGQREILGRIKQGEYLKTLCFYFSLHPEEIELLFPRIIEFFGDMTLKSSLLALVKIEKILDGKTPAEYLQSTVKTYDQYHAKKLQKFLEEKMDPQALQEAEQRRRMRVRQGLTFDAGVVVGTVVMFMSACFITTIAQNFLRFKR